MTRMTLPPITPNRRLVLLFLAADGVVFLILLAVYFYLRIEAPFWPKAFHFPSGLMSVAMTMFAIAASVMLLVAQRVDEKSRMLALAVVCWLTFLFLAAMEWLRVILSEHIALPQFGQTYFVLTAYQLVHVFAGTVYLIAVAARPERHDLQITGAYVHYTNLLWLVLFPALILSAIDLQGL